jgi:AcrR family transcriptional regulator
MDNRQKSTESTLATEQAEVIASLVSGATVTAATKAAGVGRSTFYLWMKSDADFVAELNRAQKERETAVRAQLDSLADAALDALREMLDPDTPPAVRLKAALQILARSR